jgi:hypothetical protein
VTNLFSINGVTLIPVTRKPLAAEKQLEEWIAQDPRALGLDILVIGRQVNTPHGGFIDLLGLDRDGNLSVIELKKDKTPRDVVAQALDYGSWVRTLEAREIEDLALDYLKRPVGNSFLEFFGEPLPEALNTSHSLTIVASQFDAASRRIIEYLTEDYGVAINTLFFDVFEHHGELLLSSQWLLDQEVVQEKVRARKDKAPWTGYWYVNAGDEARYRSWEDMRRYGFVAAGGGTRYSGALKRLSVGRPVFAYQKSRGYVGYGIVTSEAVPARDFRVGEALLFDQPLTEPGLKHDSGNLDLEEWAVGIEWKKTKPLSDAAYRQGLFANQNIVCKLSDAETLDFLKSQFID